MDTKDIIKNIEHDLRDMNNKCYVCGEKTNIYFIIPGENPIKICSECFSKSVKKYDSKEE